MIAQVFLRPMSASHQTEPTLKWMIVLSFALHFAAVALLMGMPPSSSEKIYFSPAYTVDLVGAPPGGGGGAPTGSKADSEAAAKPRKPSVKLWKGPDKLESQAKAQTRRSHPLMTIPAKEKKIERRSEPELVREASPGSAQQASGTGQASATQQGAASAQSGADQGRGTGSGSGPGQGAGPGGPGTGPGGGMGGNLRFSHYYKAVYEKIYQAWTLPDYVMEQQSGREAIVVIIIQRDGKIVGAEFEKTSGNRQLDTSVMNAIRKADPLPPLPEDYRDSVLELGIRFTPPQT